jgi:hypothetical protein
MVDKQRARVEDAMKKLIDDLDRVQLRKMQVGKGFPQNLLNMRINEIRNLIGYFCAGGHAQVCRSLLRGFLVALRESSRVH